jgi:hypothetical protein
MLLALPGSSELTRIASIPLFYEGSDGVPQVIHAGPLYPQPVAHDSRLTNVQHGVMNGSQLSQPVVHRMPAMSSCPQCPHGP